VQLETERLIFRSLQKENLTDFARLLSDPQVMEFASSGTTYDKEQSAGLLSEYLEAAKKHKLGICALILKKQSLFIGYCGLEWHLIDHKVQPELVYCLAPPFWNLGLATEAARAIKSYAMEKLKISPLISLIKKGNLRSIRVAEKLGGQLEGTLWIHHVEKLLYKYEN
jgi:RimJ/RimL family protein N-acetyltransferase